MRKERKKHHAAYKPIPHHKRFWIYSESCYTEEELSLRAWIIKTRANSGIHSDYLSNPSSWFAEDSQALINLYEHSWFYSPAFTSRHSLNPDDFRVQPIENQLQWPSLYELMQKVGDYLLLRNYNLPLEHLNQPMNFVLLDLNHMLKSLSQRTNIVHVKEQLELITRYARIIEKRISPQIGTDRLFLANFRRIIDEKIHPQLTHLIESQLLRERLNELSKSIKELSANRNRILHFALNINPVNPHSYEFSLEHLEDTSAYPTQAAKECAQNNKNLIGDANSTPIINLTANQLASCPKFKLISMDEDILQHYSKAISDLNELERFQQVITHIMELLGKAGEVFTIHQFKLQMSNLLGQINGFIDFSSQHIEAIIHTNTEFYHKAIEDEQNLSLIKKWFTSEKLTLQTFIKNQDNLAQFPSTVADLSKTDKEIKTQINQVLIHLNHLRSVETSIEAIAGQTQTLDKLMGSMHQRFKMQYEITEPSKALGLEPQCSPVIPDVPSLIGPPTDEAFHYHPHFFVSKPTLPTQVDTFNITPYRANFTYPATSNPGMSHLGFMAIVPIGFIALYLISQWNKIKGREHDDNCKPSLCA
jgi:hypothetical protein